MLGFKFPSSIVVNITFKKKKKKKKRITIYCVLKNQVLKRQASYDPLDLAKDS